MIRLLVVFAVSATLFLSGLFRLLASVTWDREWAEQ